MTNEITLRLTPDQYNTIVQALQVSVQWVQQNTALTIAGIQSQVQAQIAAVTPAATTSPAQPQTPVPANGPVAGAYIPMPAGAQAR